MNRVSVKSKQTGLLKESKELIEKIRHEHWLRNYLSKVQIISVLASNI